MSKRVWNTLFCTLLAIFSFAQEHQCGFDHWVDALSRSDAHFFDRLESVERSARSHSFARQVDDEVYTIPLVFHILHNGESIGQGPNISDEQVKSAVEFLNHAFTGKGRYTTVDGGIRFGLARVSPECESTSGIVRKNLSNLCAEGDCYRTKGITELNQLEVKKSSQWPTRSYLNVWVVSEIDDNDGGSGIQGYAQFPGFAEETDGVVMMFNAIGYDPDGTKGFDLKSSTNRNNIFVHEVGHALGLYHTFEGDDIDRNGTGDRCPSVDACGAFLGDCVEDTPPHIRSHGNCDLSDINVCDGGNSRALFIHNFMDYSSQDCQTEFSSGQMSRMRNFMRTLRASWVSSSALKEDIPAMPVAAVCSPQTQSPSSNWDLGIHSLAIGKHSHQSGSAFEDGGYQENLCTHWELKRGETYDITVSTGEKNPQNVKVFADFNGDGRFEAEAELILASDMAKTHGGKLKIPSNAAMDQTLRLRAISDYPGFEISSACYEPLYGQVEDYTFSTAGSNADDTDVTEDQPDPVDPPVDPEDHTEEEPVLDVAAEVGVSLSASPFGRRARLSWSALDDRTVDRYELQRSRDSKEFSRVFTLRSSRKINARYLAYDFKPETFYRIRVILRSGKSFFSETVSISSGASAGFELYPNPRLVESSFTVNPKGPVWYHTIELMDLSGKLIRRQQFEEQMEQYSVSVPILAKGIYVVRALGHDTVETAFLSQL
ncbi:MAG: zinc-dependent metalloprotease [Saprospiraceae bacterium]|nr:zinc-dependent metalloprotease [Saprospiraceae bacterium]